MAIAMDDPSAITMLAAKFDVDPIILEALSAACTQNLERLREAVPKLATIPGIDLHPEIANVLISLAWNNTNEVNTRTAVKTAVLLFNQTYAIWNVAPSKPFDLSEQAAIPLPYNPVIGSVP